jgi:hypothetical protein
MKPRFAALATEYEMAASGDRREVREKLPHAVVES